MILPLNKANLYLYYTIVSIDSNNDERTVQRLHELGFNEGTIINLTQRSGNRIVVEIMNSRIALDPQTASLIKVQEV